jgi:hypothetical protein
MPSRLSKFVDSYAPVPGKPLTFGAFDESSGRDFVFSADCLTLCGNAYEPSVYALWDGPHAVSYMQVLLEAMLSSDEAIAASDVWANQIVKAKGGRFCYRHDLQLRSTILSRCEKGRKLAFYIKDKTNMR